MPPMAARLAATDLTDPDTVAYFTWDAPMTVRQIHEVLRTGSEAERFALLGAGNRPRSRNAKIKVEPRKQC